MAGETKTCSLCKESKERSEFHIRASRCKPCARRVSKEWGRNNRARMLARQKLNRDKIDYFEKRRIHLKYRYGVTPEQCEIMLSAQANKCAICCEIFSGTPHIDHCHKTKIVRGLLCDRCNRGLGYFKDNPEFLRAAASYVGERTK